jgi:hypothetical protein
MTDLSDFKPDTIQELVEKILSVVSAEGTKWWEKTRKAVKIHIKTLSQAVLTTQAQVAMEQMSNEEAKYFFDEAKESFETVIPFTKYMGAAAAHRIVKEAMKIVGWAIYNLTGFNFFPAFVEA